MTDFEQDDLENHKASGKNDAPLPLNRSPWSWIEIDGTGLLRNAKILSDHAPKSHFAPVLKSNAYGHGLRETYQILSSIGLRWICVNYLYEAKQLRQWGFSGRILVVGPASWDGWEEASHIQADLVVGNISILKSWITQPLPVNIHLKFDTGMGRQGFLPQESGLLLDTIRQHGREKELKGICTHFANVEDVTDQSYALKQIQRFNSASDVFRQSGLKILYHCASSASTLIMDQTHFDLVRVGISLYGLWPSSLTRVSYLQLHQNLLDLTPVMSWVTQIAALKKIPKGEFIGYGCTFRAIRDMLIAVLPVGYYEGYPRLAGENPCYVLIGGQRCPIVGRICMNMMMVDISHLENNDGKTIEVGTRVTLIGRDNGDGVSAQDLASWAKTIHYEIITRISPEIPRVIIDGEIKGRINQ
jgi:alanine racemase